MEAVSDSETRLHYAVMKSGHSAYVSPLAFILPLWSDDS